MSSELLYICPKCSDRLTHEELKNNNMRCLGCGTPFVYTWRSY